MAKKKKQTKKLGAQELEKRKAPFASPIVYRDGDGTGGGGMETPTQRRETVEAPEPSLPKPPRMDRITR